LAKSHHIDLNVAFLPVLNNRSLHFATAVCNFELAVVSSIGFGMGFLGVIDTCSLAALIWNAYSESSEHVKLVRAGAGAVVSI
jgi:hypothetical protein